MIEPAGVEISPLPNVVARLFIQADDEGHTLEQLRLRLILILAFRAEGQH